jgi:hypothetical protein
MDRYWLSKSVSISNTFEGFEEELDYININARVKKQPNPIFIASLDNFSSLLQLYSLSEIAIGDYEIKITNNE